LQGSLLTGEKDRGGIPRGCKTAARELNRISVAAL
jgi:hypothetical protein